MENNEQHPAIPIAISFLKEIGVKTLQDWRIKFGALENNIVADKCKETIDELLSGKTPSDMDILGLAWLIRFNLYETIIELKERQVTKLKEKK